ncbi:VanZ family protein [Aliivibrio sp. S2TY2]|uniref:VanZ family protein n=1 Tax=unclassified Aliivibrio TaxID=2645654 RepID=UPI0023791AE1|nr:MULTISPECIES: VanZ family protein [unclassified Aliivibrio]MDD9175001.1 VanZ family protein [Aliivibrio sp. S3TY1]MDD9192052.1 VanZ family protein [Aliivibrio sp. S2TY2]
MGKIAKIPFIILIASVLLFGGASFLKSSGVLIDQIRDIEATMHGSIYLHLCASLLLGIFCRLATRRNLCLGLPITSIFILLLVIIDESLQFFIPLRQFSWLDMLVNACGILAGTYIMNGILRLRSNINILCS